MTQTTTTKDRARGLIGKRIRLLRQMTNPDSKWMPVEDGMPAGLEGTIRDASFDGPADFHQILVRWDNGRSLALLPHVDSFVVLDSADTQPESQS